MARLAVETAAFDLYLFLPAYAKTVSSSVFKNGAPVLTSQ